MKNLQIGSSTFNSVNRVQFHTPDGDIVTYTDMGALEKKNVTLTENNVYHIYPDVEDGMSEVTVTVRNTGEGLNINGVIEEYRVAAGATVHAGDFVEFVNQWNKGEIISSNPIALSACKLDNTRVFVAYLYSNSNNDERVSAAVVSIKDNEIEVGPIENLTGWQGYYLQYVSADALTDNKVVVAISNQYSSGYNGYLQLLSIENLDISITESSIIKYCAPIQVRALTNNTFAMAYQYNNGGTFDHTWSYLTLYQVSNGEKMQQVSSFNLYGSSYGSVPVSALLKLSPTKVLCVESGWVTRIYGLENNVITQSSKSLSIGSTVDSAAALSETSVLIARMDGYIQAIDIDGTNQTLGTAQALDTYVKVTTTTDDAGNTTTTESTETCPVRSTSITALNANQALIAYFNTIDNKSYSVVATVKGTNITLGIPVNHTDYSDINQLIPFSDSSVVNIFANEFIGGVGLTIGDRDGYTGDWYLDVTPDQGLSGTLTLAFTSNDTDFVGVTINVWTSGGHAHSAVAYVKTSGYEKTVWNDTEHWKDRAQYRYITLYNEPSGTAKSWLDTNGTRKAPFLKTDLLTNTYVQPATSRFHNVGVAKEGGEEGDLIGVYCVSTI